jgi:hypothetical protein
MNNERWGKKFVDERDWPAYNEELVVRGEFLLDLDWAKSWDKELEVMNSGKRGAPYEFPDSLIGLQAVWHQWVDYRGLEGITRKIAEAGQLPKFNDYTTINRRVNRMPVAFKLPAKGKVNVACDGSGMKFENAGEYRARMYGKKRRKYIKVAITADPVKKKLLECEAFVEGEGLSEPDTAMLHMEQLMAQGLGIAKFWGDGSFDTNDLFNFLDDIGAEAAIKPCKDAVPNPEKSRKRAEEIELIREKGYRKWARLRQYGLRWLGTEGIFSAVKRKFGEQTRSHKIENALDEVKRKFWAYDEMKAYAEARA